MKTRLIVYAAALVLITACGGNAGKKAATADVPDMHTAEIALNYRGTYKGTLPAADCPGIEVKLILYLDGTYSEHNEYLERDTQFDERGGYSATGNLLTLTPADGEGVSYYKIEENRLRRLDADKQPIGGELKDHYVLTKTIE